MSDRDEKTALAKAHAILRAGLREVPFEEWPPAPWHAGGPALTCPAVGQIGVSLWCVDVLVDRAAAAEKKELSRLRSLVDAFLQFPRFYGSPTGPDAKLHANLLDGGKALKTDSAALACMRRAASGAATYLRGKPDLVFSSSTAAVVRTVKELTARPTPLQVKAFLAQLDQRLMCAELAGAYRERMKKPAPELSRVFFRAADSSGKVTCFVARLENGHFGVLVKLGGKSTRGNWTWVEGARDDALATVPDAMFKAATARVLAE